MANKSLLSGWIRRFLLEHVVAERNELMLATIKEFSTYFVPLIEARRGEPKGDLAAAINSAFGSFAGFQEKLTAAGLGRFGSGWAWLVVKDGKCFRVASYQCQWLKQFE